LINLKCKLNNVLPDFNFLIYKLKLTRKKSQKNHQNFYIYIIFSYWINKHYKINIIYYLFLKK